MNENCLVLNVWTPAVDDGLKRPVTFWCHGRRVHLRFGLIAVIRRHESGAAKAMSWSSPSIEKMSNAWLAFAHRQSESRVDSELTAVSSETRPTMIFDNECRVENDPQGTAPGMG